MSDFKYDCQLEAEEIADLEYGRDFFALDPATRAKVYSQAEAKVINRGIDRADFLHDRAREK